MEVAIFGSAARGSNDLSSDFDVIAVIEDIGSVDKDALQNEFSLLAGKEVGLSIYSKARIKSLWDEGSPFAWHLYQQAVPFFDFSCAFIREWGAPAEYNSAREDCEMMRSIISSVIERLKCSDLKGDCYEAGLLYVGVRNIGMFSSLSLTGSFDFSRNASFTLNEVIEFPLDVMDFSTLVRARHAATRGGEVPVIDRAWLYGVAAKVSRWADLVINKLDGV
ncbi:nucleotidyltransferase domain-containing protein [Stenotrophomonas sp.]|uniref:nucleotidyltransferase domain-containing protein n=1 Tax=Stenotrophomonas sp. TaxID=69392 RepID=UPI0028AD64F1|nr:nucleotidyltransferase domain-containing protein [Stenotrophomonas sp.]